MLLGFSGLYCYLWDADSSMALIKVNTKGGNRPIRARYGLMSPGSSTKRAQIVYAYGDCLAIGHSKPNLALNQQAESRAKYDLTQSIHGREIMQVIGLNKGTTLITGSEDTTFKVLRVVKS